MEEPANLGLYRIEAHYRRYFMCFFSSFFFKITFHHVACCIFLTWFASVREITPELQTIVRYVMHSFYDDLQAIIVEIIVRDKCVKADDIIELCQLEKAQVLLALK